MRIATDSFRGEAPRLTPRALPANAAQAAVNAKLVSGDLEAWRQFATTKTLTAAAAVQTMCLLNDKWLSWMQQVDVARGIIAGDNTYRTYLTCPALYTVPQWTNYAMATTGAEPYPVATRPLGVPGPDAAPTVAVSVDAQDASNIGLTNPGAETGTTAGWTIGSGSLVVHSNGDIVGLNAQAGTKFFGGGNVAASVAYQDVNIAAAGVVQGQGLKLAWWQAKGAAGSTAAMEVEFYDNTPTLLPGATVAASQMAPAAVHTWERRELTAEVPAGAVTARLIQRYARVGAGPAIDAYVDSITLTPLTYTSHFDASHLSGWDLSPNQGGPGDKTWREIELNGIPAGAIAMRGDTLIPWMYRDFGTDEASAVSLKFDFMHQSGTAINALHVLPFADLTTGAGTGIYLERGGDVQVASCTGSDDGGTIVETIATARFAQGKWYRATLTMQQSGIGKAKVTVHIEDKATGTPTGADVTTSIPINGPRIALRAHTGPIGGEWGWFGNIDVSVAPPVSKDVVITTATSYVYRFINDVGEASAPSPASETVIRPDGGAATVTTPTAVPTGTGSYFPGATLKQIYRAITGASGTAFVLVAEIPLAQADYVDAYDDSEIAGNEVLDSEDWDLPPADLEGIIALPNGLMAGFRRNQLCLSVSGRPHAWRVADRHPTDTDIVAIANIDNTIVIGTKKAVYTATGNSNDSYSMSAPGALQACVAKRGMVFLDGVGVVFPSPDGWMACAGSAGALTNISEGIFTKQQWEALGPTSIIATVHDGALYWFSTGQTPDSGFALDMRANGFGLVSLSFHANAAFVDPLTDALYLVLDAINEPTDALLPVASTAPTLASPAKVIFKFDGATNGDKLRYRWRGKLHLPPYPVTMTMAQAHAADFANLVLRIYADGVLLHAKAIGSLREFTLPALATHDSYEVELIGTSTARTAQLVEDVAELAT